MYKSLMARIVFVSASAIAAVLLLFIAANQYAAARLRTQTIESQEMLLQLYVAQMDQSLDALRIGMVQHITEDLDLNALCFYDTSGDEYKLSAQSCKKWLNQNLLTNPLISSQFIYDENTGMLLTASQAFASTRHHYINSNLPLFLQRTGSVGSRSWKRLFTSGYLTESSTPGWLLIKTIAASKSVTLGTVVAVPDLLPLLENSISYEGTITQVYSKDGYLLTQSPTDSFAGPAMEPEIAAHLKNNDQSYVILNQADGKRYIAISSTLSTAQVHIVILAPETAILQQLTQFQYIGSFLSCLLALVTLLSTAAIPILYKPFAELIQIMEGVANGDLSLRLPKGHTSEFRQVNAGFNDMVQRIAQLNRDIYEQNLRVHKAEIMHLQAQINPHFYQNTLNLIYNLAALKEYELIQKTALHLADYFRFIMRSGDRTIHLRDELTHINNYMELQKIRYPRAIEYQCIVQDDAILDDPILPLLIQPFVENSVIHGFTRVRSFRIEVRVLHLYEGSLHVEIEDNGNGISDEMVFQLNQLMNESEPQSEEHIGIRNVVNRLKRCYGSRASLHIHSHMGHGTCVYIELPIDKP